MSTVTHTVGEQIARTPAAPAGTARSRKPFFPATWRGWLCATSIVVVIILASLGWLTNGRAGLVGVVGNSMSSVMPDGSSVITLPLPPREGDYVVALAGTPDDQSGMTRDDGSRSLVVKKYHNGRLVSTDDANVYSQFEYRGRVVARIPTQKILFWRDKGAQKTTMCISLDRRAAKISSQLIRQAAHKEMLAAKGLIKYSPRILSPQGSKLDVENGCWSDPRIVPDKPIDIESTFIEFVVDRESWMELSLWPVPPTLMTRDEKPTVIETGWLKPGKYRLTWIFRKGCSSDTPSCTFKFYKKK